MSTYPWEALYFLTLSCTALRRFSPYVCLLCHRVCPCFPFALSSARLEGIFHHNLIIIPAPPFWRPRASAPCHAHGSISIILPSHLPPFSRHFAPYQVVEDRRRVKAIRYEDAKVLSDPSLEPRSLLFH